MDGFYQLVCLLISLAGFMIVIGVLLIRGEPILVTAVKGVLAFVALKIILGVLSKLFNAVACSENTNEINRDNT
ncbi:MAG: hypothetical protein QHH26_08135 [Armatimonadota bacterium]|nr:hypothetical protein [Armatimonadota bacterium]